METHTALIKFLQKCNRIKLSNLIRNRCDNDWYYSSCVPLFMICSFCEWNFYIQLHRISKTTGLLLCCENPNEGRFSINGSIFSVKSFPHEAFDRRENLRLKVQYVRSCKDVIMLPKDSASMVLAKAQIIGKWFALQLKEGHISFNHLEGESSTLPWKP